MKINTQKKNPVKLILIIVALTLVLGGSAYAIYSLNKTPEERNDQKTEESEKPEEKQPVDKTDKPAVDTTTDKIPVSKTASAKITSMNQRDGFVNVTAEIRDTTANGNCSIVFENSNARPVSLTVGSTTSGAVTSCDSIKIPETEFSFIGSWKATLRYFVGDEQVVAQESIEIK